MLNYNGVRTVRFIADKWMYATLVATPLAQIPAPLICNPGCSIATKGGSEEESPQDSLYNILARIAYLPTIQGFPGSTIQGFPELSRDLTVIQGF
jgi:hypothetical protein